MKKKLTIHSAFNSDTNYLHIHTGQNVGLANAMADFYDVTLLVPEHLAYRYKPYVDDRVNFQTYPARKFVIKGNKAIDTEAVERWFAKNVDADIVFGFGATTNLRDIILVMERAKNQINPKLLYNRFDTVF